MKINKTNIGSQDPKRRVRDYVGKIIQRAYGGYTTIPKANLAKALHLRKATVMELLNELVDDGEFIRYDLPNKNRKNPRHKYTFGNSNKSECIRGAELKGNLGEKEMKLVGLDLWNMADRLDLIAMYIDSGFDVIPLVPRAKRRMMKDEVWDLGYKGNKTSIINFFADNADANVGARMRGQLFVVDIDCLPQWLEKTEGETWETLTSSSGKKDKEHLWFWNTANLGNAPQVYGGVADFICTNNLVMVLPPSIHPNGTQYSWLDLSEPQDVPSVVQEMYQAHKKQYAQLETLPIADGHKRVRRLPAPAKVELPDRIDKKLNPEVSRHLTYFRYGRSLLRRGVKIEVIAQELVNYNAVSCNPPKTDKELREIIRQIETGTNRPNWNADGKDTKR
jgi:hypothetical protein